MVDSGERVPVFSPLPRAESFDPLKEKAKTLERAQSREDFSQFESIVNCSTDNCDYTSDKNFTGKMPNKSHIPKRVPRDDPDNRSYDDDDDGGGIGSCLAALIQAPVLIAAAIIVPIFGIVFVVCGIIFIASCNMEPMIPVWLIVQGIILLFGIGIGGLAKKTSKNSSSNFVVKIVSFVLFLFTFAWFVAGNYFIYNAYAQSPDFGHFWYNNACDPAIFRLAFVCIIVLDCLFALSFVVGIIAFILRGCKRR